MMKVIVVFKRLLASGKLQPMAAIYSNGGITAGIFLASILLKEMRYLVYTAISIKVVPRAKRKSRIRARKAAGNR